MQILLWSLSVHNTSSSQSVQMKFPRSGLNEEIDTWHTSTWNILKYSAFLMKYQNILICSLLINSAKIIMYGSIGDYNCNTNCYVVGMSVPNITEY